MKIKKVASLFLAGVIGATMLVGCNSGSTLDAIKEKGKIVMYTNAAFPPFEYMEGDTVAGVDADIAAEIANDLDVELEIVNIEFDSALLAVQNGKADFVAAGVTVNEERKRVMDFTDTYAQSVQYLVMSEDKNYETASDLEGLSIGVQEGTTGDFVSTDDITDSQVSRFRSALEATMDMKTGRLDVVMIDKLPAENIVSVNDGLKCVEFKYDDGTNTDEEYAIGVKKGNTALLEAINKTIARLKSEGKIDEFIKKHTLEAAV